MLKGLRWEGTEYVPSRIGWHHEEVPMPDSGTASMGDLRELRTYDDPRDIDAYEMPYTVWGDYAGGGVERANWTDMVDEYGDYVVDVVGGYGSHYIAVPLSLALRCAEDERDIWGEVMEIVEGLEGYPLINDETLSQIEMDEFDRAWDDWMSYDILRRIEGRISDEDRDRVSDSEIKDAWYRLYGQTDMPEYPYLEDAVNLVVPGWEDVADMVGELITRRCSEVRWGDVTLAEPDESMQGRMDV